MELKQRLYDQFNPLLGALRGNHLLIRKLFGVRLKSEMAVQFDPTTILLSLGVKRHYRAEDRSVLELGIGQAALVSLSLALKFPIAVHGIDLSPARVDQSLQVAAYNGINANFFQSDLFAGIPTGSKYDLIFFNPPYVPTADGQALRFTERWRIDHDRVWDGGRDGTSVIASFLDQVSGYLAPAGRVLFGVQNLFVPDSRILSLVGDSRLKLHSRFKKRLIPSTVYVLQHA